MRNGLLLVVLVLIVGLSGCREASTSLHGYIETRMTMVSSPISGKLVKLSVHRGQHVNAGDPLFNLDQEPEISNVNADQAAVASAEAELKNASRGKRVPELQAIEAEIHQARAEVVYMKKQLQRFKKLQKTGNIEQDAIDKSQQDLAVREAKVVQLQAQLATAKLPERDFLIKAAQAKLTKAQADLTAEQWRLQQNKIKAPVAGLVFDTFFRPGEQVNSRQPVVAIITPDEVYALFYVPEKQLSKIKLGEKVQLHCDSCTTSYSAIISYISTEAEFTPPVIYSQRARAKLVYRVEARLPLGEAEKLHPGQPVDVIVDTDVVKIGA